MRRGLRLYLVGSVALVALAGCGRYMAFQEREPWRKQAEVECIKSGAVKVTQEKAQVAAINGPGMCGADFPFKVAALGDNPLLGYGPEPRPPGAIGNQSMPPQMRWMSGPPPARYEDLERAAPGEPMRIAPQSSAPSMEPPQYSRPVTTVPARGAPQPQAADDFDDEDDIPDDAERAQPRGRAMPPQTRPAYQLPRAQPPALGPQRPYSGAVGPATLTPAATLACPVVAALDQWVAKTVQPAALKWFNQPVVEIKQISAYSCRGMNGNPRANISEHAFGNALDISAFVLADGHRVTVKGGWRGTPEEQAFLHDVQGGACQQFNTVLAPGSNIYHYDHIHVDLMRRSSGRRICQPGAVDGEVVAARAGRNRLARGEPTTTGSIGKPSSVPRRGHIMAVPGEDGVDDE